MHEPQHRHTRRCLGRCVHMHTTHTVDTQYTYSNTHVQNTLHHHFKHRQTYCVCPLPYSVPPPKPPLSHNDNPHSHSWTPIPAVSSPPTYVRTYVPCVSSHLLTRLMRMTEELPVTSSGMGGTSCSTCWSRSSSDEVWRGVREDSKGREVYTNNSVQSIYTK